MKNRTIRRSSLVLAVAVAMILVGCIRKRELTVIEGDIILGAPERVTEYLRLVYNTGKRDDAHKLLTSEARKEIPLKDFRALLRDELSDVFETRVSSELQVRVDHLKSFAITDDHYIVYSLLQIVFPYADGSKDKYRLTRFHAYRRGGAWYLEPFINKRTFTKRLVPSLLVGTHSELEQKRPEFYDIIGKDLLKERKKMQALAESSEGAEKGTAKVTEKIGDLAIPDLRVEQPDRDNGSDDEIDTAKLTGAEAKRQVDALITVGKLHFQTGNIAAAEESFRKVLEIDELNGTAKDFLKKCADIRLLEKEKKELLDLYERLLELDETEDLKDESSGG